MRNLCGEGSHCTIPFNHMNDRFLPDALLHSTAIITDENQVDSRSLKSETFKALCTQDKFNFEMKFRGSFEFCFHGRIIQCINNLIKFDDTTDSLYRRFLIVPFTKSFTGAERKYIKGSRTGSYLTIEQADGFAVPVGVWAVTEADEARLDRYEGYPAFYYKTEMDISYTGLVSKKQRKVRAFVYIMHEDRLYGIPSYQYVETCREGYADFGFDEDILADAYDFSKEEALKTWGINY